MTTCCWLSGYPSLWQSALKFAKPFHMFVVEENHIHFAGDKSNLNAKSLMDEIPHINKLDLTIPKKNMHQSCVLMVWVCVGCMSCFAKLDQIKGTFRTLAK